MMSCRNIVHQPDEVLDSSLNSWVRRVTWYMIYQPDEVLDGRFVGQLDEISHMVYDEPGHVFRITQVLALQCTAHMGLLGLSSV